MSVARCPGLGAVLAAYAAVTRPRKRARPARRQPRPMAAPPADVVSASVAPCPTLLGTGPNPRRQAVPPACHNRHVLQAVKGSFRTLPEIRLAPSDDAARATRCARGEDPRTPPLAGGGLFPWHFGDRPEGGLCASHTTPVTPTACLDPARYSPAAPGSSEGPAWYAERPGHARARPPGRPPRPTPRPLGVRGRAPPSTPRRGTPRAPGTVRGPATSQPPGGHRRRARRHQPPVRDPAEGGRRAEQWRGRTEARRPLAAPALQAPAPRPTPTRSDGEWTACSRRVPCFGPPPAPACSPRIRSSGIG